MSLAGAAAIGVFSVLALASTTPRRARVRAHTNNVAARVEPEAPRTQQQVAAGVATVVPAVAKMVAPKQPESNGQQIQQAAVTKKTESKAAEKKTSTESKYYPVVGVPLWDGPATPPPKPKPKENADNPYD